MLIKKNIFTFSFVVRIASLILMTLLSPYVFANTCTQSSIYPNAPVCDDTFTGTSANPTCTAAIPSTCTTTNPNITCSVTTSVGCTNGTCLGTYDVQGPAGLNAGLYTGNYNIPDPCSPGNNLTIQGGNAFQLTVFPAPQTITYTSTPPSPGNVGTTYTVTATGGASGNPVTFSSGTPAICTVSGSLVTFIAVGTCTVNADQAASTNYAAAPTTPQNITVAQGSQTITYTSIPPSPARVGNTYTVSATGGGSGNPVIFSSGTPATCTVSGSLVTFVAVGTCTINANQAGDANYTAAPQAPQSFTISQGLQTITYTSIPPSPGSVGGTYTVAATGGGSGNPVTFSSGTPAICTVSGSLVTFVAVGTCTVNANQAGNANYAAATQTPQNITVGQGTQTITYTSTPPSPARVGNTYTVSATGGASGNPVVFSSGTPATCTVSGSLVTFIAVGTCTVNANQAGNANYSAAPQTPQSFTISQGLQTITYTSTPPVPSSVGGTYTVSATGGASGNPVIFSSGTPATCSVSGNLVTFIASGTCTVNANQAGNANYAAATQTPQNITVDKANQTITITNPAPPTASVEETYTPQATGGASGNPVVFSIDPSSTPGACSISGGIVSFTNPGDCIIDADQAGNANYNAANQVQQITVVIKATQTITFNSEPPANPEVGGNYLLSATGGDSGNPVIFSIDASSTAGACTLTGNLVNFTGHGTCIIDANQAGNIDFEPAPQMQQTLQIAFAPIGSLTLVKNALGRDGTFTFATSIAGAGVVTLATTNGSAQYSFPSLPVGTYTLSETNLPPGWKLTDVQCNGTTMDPAAVSVTIVPGSAVTCVFTNVFDVAYIQQKTLEAIASFLNNRAHLILSATPDRRRIVQILSNTLQPSTSPSIRPNVGENQLNLNLSASLRQLENNSFSLPRSLDFWAEAHVNYFKRRPSHFFRDHAEFSLVYVGADYLYSDNILLGALGEFDNFNERSNAVLNLHATGNGWMVGPYLSARLLPDLYFHSRMAFGTSHNRMNPFIEYDTFNTFRQLYDAEVMGDFLFSTLRVSPSIGVIYFNERQGHFLNSLDVDIPSQNVSLGQLVVGPELGYPLYASEQLAAELRVILEGIYNFQNTGYLIPQQTTLSNFYGRIYVGADILTKKNISFYPMFMWDGVGANFENVSGQLQIRTSID